MRIPISVKAPDKVILIYDDADVEIEATFDSKFELLTFYADEETVKRLNDKGVLADQVKVKFETDGHC